METATGVTYYLQQLIAADNANREQRLRARKEALVLANSQNSEIYVESGPETDIETGVTTQLELELELKHETENNSQSEPKISHEFNSNLKSKLISRLNSGSNLNSRLHLNTESDSNSNSKSKSKSKSKTKSKTKSRSRSHLETELDTQLAKLEHRFKSEESRARRTRRDHAQKTCLFYLTGYFSLQSDDSMNSDSDSNSILDFDSNLGSNLESNLGSSAGSSMTSISEHPYSRVSTNPGSNSGYDLDSSIDVRLNRFLEFDPETHEYPGLNPKSVPRMACPSPVEIQKHLLPVVESFVRKFSLDPLFVSLFHMQCVERETILLALSSLLDAHDLARFADSCYKGSFREFLRVIEQFHRGNLKENVLGSAECADLENVKNFILKTHLSLLNEVEFLCSDLHEASFLDIEYTSGLDSVILKLLHLFACRFITSTVGSSDINGSSSDLLMPAEIVRTAGITTQLLVRIIAHPIREHLNLESGSYFPDVISPYASEIADLLVEIQKSIYLDACISEIVALEYSVFNEMSLNLTRYENRNLLSVLDEYNPSVEVWLLKVLAHMVLGEHQLQSLQHFQSLYNGRRVNVGHHFYAGIVTMLLPERLNGCSVQYEVIAEKYEELEGILDLQTSEQFETEFPNLAKELPLRCISPSTWLVQNDDSVRMYDPTSDPPLTSNLEAPIQLSMSTVKVNCALANNSCEFTCSWTQYDFLRQLWQSDRPLSESELTLHDFSLRTSLYDLCVACEGLIVYADDGENTYFTINSKFKGCLRKSAAVYRFPDIA